MKTPAGRGFKAGRCRYVPQAALLVVAAVALGGCAVGPDFVRPGTGFTMPEAWTALHAAGADSADVAGRDAGAAWRWWEAFGDTTLNGLVDEALAHNNDLAAAAGRVLEARALLGGSRASMWPALEVGGSASRSQSSRAIAGGAFFPGVSELYGADATLRYEADLWGRLSRGREAALATLTASEHDRRTVAQRLVAEVVNTWLVVGELQMQTSLTGRTVHSYEQSLNAVDERYVRGLVPALDRHLSSMVLATARVAAPRLALELATARRRLEILTGRYPRGDAGSGAPDSTALTAPLAEVPAGLPSKLLERRPDVMAAEARLHAAVARIGEAKAALFPRLALTGASGSKSADLVDLFTKPAETWSLAGNLLMPLLNRGATQAQSRAAEARAQQAAAAYRQTALAACSDVETALDRDRYQADQETLLVDAVRQARRASALAEDRYRRGLDNLMATLETQRVLFGAESQLLTTRRLRRAARVDLIVALGGTWEMPPQSEDAEPNLHEGAGR